jgi:hypothetical protein
MTILLTEKTSHVATISGAINSIFQTLQLIVKNSSSNCLESKKRVKVDLYIESRVTSAGQGNYYTH